MAIRRAPSNGKPKLPPLVEARLMVAADCMKITGSDALTDAAERWIKWSEQVAPRRAYAAQKADYDAGRSNKSPDPRDYNLPPDHGLPAPRP